MSTEKTVQSQPRRPANLEEALEHDLSAEMREAHIRACQPPQSNADWFVSGMATGVALAAIVFAVITLATRH